MSLCGLSTPPYLAQSPSVLLLILLLAFPLQPVQAEANDEAQYRQLTMGVFAFRPKEIMERHYQPLADHLSEQLGDTRVVLEVLNQDEIEAAMDAQRLDLLFTNPSHYVLVRSQNPLTGALATLFSMADGDPTDQLGGVIITRHDSLMVTDLRQMRGKHIGVPGVRFLGGYQTQAFELQQAGVRLPQHAELHVYDGHDAVVQAVLAGEVEYGFIRTGIIEAMEREGKIDPALLQVVNAQQYPNFPYRVSTRLYPEWAFVALPHVDRRQVRIIASSLMGLEESYPAARAAGIGGFSPPGDYLPVENLARALRMPPFDERIPLVVLWEDHRKLAISTIIMIGAATLWLLWIIARMVQQRRRADAALRQAASVFEHANEGIVITDPDANILEVNTAFSEITGYSREEVLGKNPRLLSSGDQGPEFYAAMWQALKTSGQWRGELWNRHKNGEVYAELLTISTIRDAGGKVQHYIGLFADITQLKYQQNQLEYMAHYDALTGLPNRVLLADRLHQAMAQASRRRSKVAVVYLDLDGFKTVNDTHGHDMGDLLLISLAEKMKEALRDGDTLARLGGDEFVAVLLDLPTPESSLQVLERMLHTCAEAVTIGERILRVSASIGVSFFPQDEELDADQLLRQADQAMYQAKQTGKNRYHIFDTEHDHAVRGQYESLERIREALGKNEFVLYYQPKVNMRSGEVIGAEALIRWQHPERGLLPPAAFLPVLEHHPLSIELGEWVLAQALEQLDRWRSQGVHLSVSVNIDALHLQQANFIDHLARELARHPGFTSGELELEILETSALEDINGVSEIIKDCRKLGVGFSLDDFGTGYSSLTYLKRLPAQMLKIDQSFVRDMLEDPDDLAILDGIIGLANAFQRRVIAEGVETQAHSEMLLRLGCELGQGYFIGRPMPADAMHNWLRDWQPSPVCRAIQQVPHHNLPVLFAMVEHRAWVAALGHFLRSEQATPPALDEHGCRFGQWLALQEHTHHVNHPSLAKIRQLYQQLHQQAANLIALKYSGHDEEALQGLDSMTLTQNKMLGLLQTLLDD